MEKEDTPEKEDGSIGNTVIKYTPKKEPGDKARACRTCQEKELS
jgi:hypothetical protein